MNKHLTAALLSSASLLLGTNIAFAQDISTPPTDRLDQTGSEFARAEAGSAFSWEIAVEIGIDDTYKSNTAGNEIRDIYAIGEAVTEAVIGDNISVFAGLTWESMTDPVADRSFGDMGLYIDSIGLQFEVANATFQVGKIAPAFGNAWDSVAGFYATSLAEDYELAEMLGGLADVDMGNGNTLSFGIFFADTSVLSESAGFNRGRNSKTAGGAGNTGKLNNATIQWTKEMGDTYFNLGARHLSAGLGDVSDETGFVAGIGHSFTPSGLPLDVFAEFASFDGFGGSSDNATYATLNAAYAIGNVTVSGTYAVRDITSAGKTTLASLAVEYPLTDNILIGGAYAHVDDAGVKDDRIGLNIIFTFGS